MSSAARHAAGWALAQIGTAEAAEALAGQLRWQHDSMLATVACAALAHQPRAKVSAEHRQLVQEAARQAGNDQVQRTCTFALAALASDADARRFTQQVHSSDPITAAIAAWRLGRIESPSDEVRRALMVRFVGPAGLARDAAGASLANSIRNSNKHRQAAEIADFPTAPRGSGWAKVIDRWLVAQLTPTYTPLTAEDLAPYTQQIAAALDAAQTGTRAEREAASAVVDECTPKVRDNRDAAYACLSPLADAPLRLKVRD
jgi:hypothetical protein